jgi:hypothetical protein
MLPPEAQVAFDYANFARFGGNPKNAIVKNPITQDEAKTKSVDMQARTSLMNAAREREKELEAKDIAAFAASTEGEYFLKLSTSEQANELRRLSAKRGRLFNGFCPLESGTHYQVLGERSSRLPQLRKRMPPFFFVLLENDLQFCNVIYRIGIYLNNR